MIGEDKSWRIQLGADGMSCMVAASVLAFASSNPKSVCSLHVRLIRLLKPGNEVVVRKLPQILCISHCRQVSDQRRKSKTPT
jgi:hypothetical protein